MNILYVTYLHGLKWTGPNYSVPSQIKAQSNLDNVFWYNINTLFKDNDPGNVKCHTIDEYPKLKLDLLPPPFDAPDLVVFQGVYFYPYIKLANECIKKKIPYIIIPRSSLTSYAQRSKYLKKKIANTLMFNNFISKAKAIQYLTEKELQESGEKWNLNNIVIPNGINKKDVQRKKHDYKTLKGVFIGRLDIYQKGLDIFLEAVEKLKPELEKTKCIIEIYGPDKNSSKKKLESMINKKELNNYVVLKEPVFDEEKEKILISSDFFILTSRFEGHPMGLIEALAYGVPCLITEGANMAKEVEHYDAGWTSAISNDSLTESFRNLLSNIKLIEKKGQNALKLSYKYNWQELAKQSHEIYTYIIK